MSAGRWPESLPQMGLWNDRDALIDFDLLPDRSAIFEQSTLSASGSKSMSILFPLVVTVHVPFASVNIVWATLVPPRTRRAAAASPE